MRCTNLLLTRSRRLVRNVCLIVYRCEHGLPISGLVSPDVWLAQLKPFGNRKLIIACRSSRLDTTFSARRTVNRCLAAAISTRSLVVVCGQVLWWTDIAKEIIKLVRRRTSYVSNKWKFKTYIGSIRSRRACSGWYYIDSKSVAFSLYLYLSFLGSNFLTNARKIVFYLFIVKADFLLDGFVKKIRWTRIWDQFSRK